MVAKKSAVLRKVTFTSLHLLWFGVGDKHHLHEDRSWTEVFGCFVAGILVDMARMRLDRLK